MHGRSAEILKVCAQEEKLERGRHSKLGGLRARFPDRF